MVVLVLHNVGHFTSVPSDKYFSLIWCVQDDLVYLFLHVPVRRLCILVMRNSNAETYEHL